MYSNESLKSHLQSSPTIKSQSLVLAEWNMNFLDNIEKIGNYRYRKLEGSASKYSVLPNTYDPLDTGSYYTGATDSDAVIDGGIDSSTNEPIFFVSKKQKEALLFSLEDCFGRFRPRSGINKARFGITNYLHHSNKDMFKRPRFYMADKNDKFKYWTSFRTEEGVEHGVANRIQNNKNYIYDAAPFVVYEKEVPVNRVVIKMQTGVGDINLGPFQKTSGAINDPFYGEANKTTPVVWKIQTLDSKNVWSDAINFDENSRRPDGSAVVGTDGYVEVSYGLIVPNEFKNSFILNGEITSELLLPSENVVGQAYLLKKNSNDLGMLYIWSTAGYVKVLPKFGWYLEEYKTGPTTGFVKNTTNHTTYLDTLNKESKFKEFTFIRGVRIVVDTMNKAGSSFDLIELSPRLAVDLSGKTKSFSVKKMASDLGVSGMPVGQLLASTGSISLFDYDQSLNYNNRYDKVKNPKGSILAEYANKNMQIKLYEVIEDSYGISHFVPIKTMYAEGFPQVNNKERSVEINLRDMYFYLESITAPEILIQDVSLSYAVSLLLDSVGFTNYQFKRVDNESDPIIPFFFIGPKQSVAQVLQSLAVSTQTAMFFDELNNFTLMSKGYIMPTATERPTDITLFGSHDSISSGPVKNKRNNKTIANIIDISSQENNVYNDGKISYTTRYIQKSYGTLKQAYLLDKDKKWIYKPSLLWEVAGSGNTKSINEETATQGKYNLSAIPLNSTLSATVPSVKDKAIIDNIIDLGEAVYWMPRYNGYLYANGEIIKFDAIEYNVAMVGNVWITSVQDYQRYFSKIAFNGKIYPTGRVRIYSEPNYEVQDGITYLKSGPVAKHGRGQFGTSITSHDAGINSYWTDVKNVKGCTMESKYLFDPTLTAPATTTGASGISNALASKTSRTGIIKNFLSQTYAQESNITTPTVQDSQTVQASALVMNGPDFATTDSPQDFISYVHKSLSTSTSGSSYKHFGTRMRVVGKIENDNNRLQTASGATTYYSITPESADSPITVSGGGGGIAILLNPETNEGYYFEITALSEANMDQYKSADNVKNVMFYKISKNASGDATKSIPSMLYKVGTSELWPGGLAQILIDDGKFTGQSRVVAQEKNTVYDLSVEYQDAGGVRRFFLYINNTQVATVEDRNPLPIYNNMALFVRGASRCMFENVYAISSNYAENANFALDTVTNSAFGDPSIVSNESFRKYAISGIVQSTYLSGISPASPPQHNLYYEEFGTIMREASYFNVKYDKAFPSLYSRISPTFNKIRGYTVSGFHGGAYGAEFLVFNNTDTSLNLDETTGNYLRIQGLAFTQASQNDLTVDDYFSKKSDFSNPQLSKYSVVNSPLISKSDYYDIKVSRLTYGKNEFNLDATYIQSQDAANEMMGWLTSKIMKPRRSVGMKIFANPMIQLGDIVSIDYTKDGVYQIGKEGGRFVVYNIEYGKSVAGPDMTIYLSEVV